MAPPDMVPLSAAEALPEESTGAADYGGQLEREELKTATLSGARWVGMSRIVAEALGIVTMVALARLVSPAEYGTAVVVLILPMLASILTFEGFGSFIVQARSCTRDQVGSSIVMSIASGLLLSILVFALSPLAADQVFGPGTSHLAQMCAPIFLVSSFGAVPRALVLRRLDWKWFNLSEVIQLIANSIVSLALAFAGLGSEALILGALAGAAAETAVLVAVAPSGGPRWDWDAARSIVRFGASATVSGFTFTLQGNVTFLILAGRTSAAQVGLFWRAYQVGVSYQSKISLITYRVAKPVLTRAARLEDLRELHNRLLRVNVTLIVPLLALLIVLAPEVVPWVFGPQWADAVVPTQVLAVVGLWTILIGAIDPPLMAIGRPDALAIYYVVMLVATAATAWITASSGITAVAVGMVVSQAALLLAGQFFLIRGLVGVSMRKSLRVVAPALVCSGVLMLVAVPAAELLRTSVGPLALSFVVALLGLGVYAASLRVVSPSSWRDVSTLFGRVLGAGRLRRWARQRPQHA